MSLSVRSEDKRVMIVLDRIFDFSEAKTFRDAYVKNVANEYVVDFRNTEYIESSGLGILLNMYRYFEGEKLSLMLVNCRPQIKRVLLISRFESKFKIS
ncbi:STAS domain-containing protein [Marinibactrum halimedae]|uniref:Anti-anti-sigma regulatory factor n=1 Tax=Marinibactrum halimedae TaxID=1444977 RepID=A0AA37WNS4_9GAMM|nr:STAS domain-containing protein [Marinibactrum halimedae]MCD9460498.1 STAS domain-containing protein [Marinibactrum halimedae]GLS27860.1 anti-anti-sigma regulatory factor [Marinibactrum halimedae]